ncbi:MAG: HpsJ family protein [Cyanobacteria bacterium]|nr:HpsJ family protein [Cyanobacteriota bacterium]
MKAKSQKGKRTSPLVARVLLIVGLVLVASSLLDVLIALFPPDFSSRQWVFQTVTQLVDRGVVPMVGIGLLFASVWVDAKSGLSPARRGMAGDVRVWALLLSTILGFLFLILTPLHINGVRLLQQERARSIEAQAQEATQQLEVQVNQQSERFRALLANPQEFDQILASGQIPPQQAEQLRQLRSNPASLNAQAAEFKERASQQITQRREEALAQAQTQAIQSGIRTGLSSLILAVGYLSLAGMGIQGRKS